MNLIKIFWPVIITILFVIEKKAGDDPKDIEPFPTHWYEVKIIDGEQVIFIPCDYQNTEFIFENSEGKQILTEITGQDGWRSTVIAIVSIDKTTTKVNIRRPDNVPIEFTITKTGPYIFNWSWVESNYNGGTTTYSINMTTEAFKGKFREVKEPPCM